MTASGTARGAGARGRCAGAWLCACQCPGAGQRLDSPAGTGLELGLADGDGVGEAGGLAVGDAVGVGVGDGLLCFFLCGGLKISGRSKYGYDGG